MTQIGTQVGSGPDLETLAAIRAAKLEKFRRCGIMELTTRELDQVAPPTNIKVIDGDRKVCNACKWPKNINEFSYKGSKGYYSVCKECNAAASKRRYAASGHKKLSEEARLRKNAMRKQRREENIEESRRRDRERRNKRKSNKSKNPEIINIQSSDDSFPLPLGGVNGQDF